LLAYFDIGVSALFSRGVGRPQRRTRRRAGGVRYYGRPHFDDYLTLEIVRITISLIGR